MESTRPRRGPLYKQLCWFIRLRWLAAVAVLLGAILERRLGWFGEGVADRLLLVGLVIGAYNGLLALVLPRTPRSRWKLLLRLALGQLLLDMFCLTALVTWTGGVRSPLIGFFVFHMVFASLLLPTVSAYASAAAACALIPLGLLRANAWPSDAAGELQLAGILLTLPLTVMLANRITHSLRAQRRRLVRQNRRVKAMTQQLRRQQQTLVQHEKMVAMGQMAAGVTHEITNPLASMDSLLQLVERRPERWGAEKVQTLREQIARINQIIQQMKTFAHPAEMQAQRLPINEVVEQSLEMIRFDRRLKNVVVRKELDPAAGELLLLPQALQQVLINLIINALDAMADVAEPVLTIRTQRREGSCLVEVSDTGHGIQPQHVPRLFEPFFTTKPVGKGTGLGLSISYSLMQKQGGSISVRSAPGAGTTFTLRLPAHEGASRNRESSATPIAASENPAA